MKGAVLVALILARASCGVHHQDDRGDDRTGFHFVSEPLLAGLEELLPAALADLDGDGRLDLVTEERCYFARGQAWERIDAPHAVEPTGLARLIDLEGDGVVDAIFFDGSLLGP